MNKYLEYLYIVNYNFNSFFWNPTTYGDSYYNAFSYDAMGNIENQIRHDRNGDTIDNLTYHYQKSGGKLVKNRLYHLNDAQTNASAFTDDIDNMLTFRSDVNRLNTNNNYNYDEEGRLVKDSSERISKIVWRVDGKVKEIQRNGGSAKWLRFDYDAMGNRIAKHVFANNGSTHEKSTYYVLDAQGNQISTYDYEVVSGSAKFHLKERNIFGSSRIGSKQDSLNVLTATLTQNYAQVLGTKYYEFSNHLGNVLTVFSDVKIALDEDADYVVDGFRVPIRNIADYSPFGVQLDGRTIQGDFYRRGFNGMEKDDEVKGGGNSYDFGARILDPRVGRWLTIDSKTSKYPMDTPFMAFGNTPLSIVDPDGNEKIVIAGSENRDWKLNFALPAMKSIKELKSKAGNEDVTLLLFKAGYSDKQLSRIQKYVNKNGVKMQVITSSDDVVSYINNKTLSNNESGRKSDPITRINIFAHGLVGELAFGYGQDKKTEDKYRFDKDDVFKLDKSAFSSNAQIFSYACRTGAGKDVGFYGSETNPEKSLAQFFVNHLGITMYALQNRSYYSAILPHQNSEAKIAEKIGLIDKDKTYDQNAGSWDTDEAIDKVIYPGQSYTPIGSPSWTKFKKDKKPKEL